MVGERWALLVVRELLNGPKRFSELSRGLPGMSQNVLAARLRELETDSVVRNYRLGPPASTRVYELTQRGYQLEELLIAANRWGSGVPFDAVDACADLSVDALALAMKTAFDGKRAGALRAHVELFIDGDRFHADVEHGEFHIARGAARTADAILDTNVNAMRGLIFGSLSLTDALRSRAVRLTGDQRVATRFVNCFPGK